MNDLADQKPDSLNHLPVTTLKGVGPALEKTLAGLHIHTVLDLLFHLPHRYQDRTRLTPIGALQHGVHALIEGEIAGTAVVFGKRRSLLVKVMDKTGVTSLRFYHFNNAQKNAIDRKKRMRAFGEARYGSSGLELYHPDYQLLEPDQHAPLDTTLTPIYPVTEGLHQSRLRGLITQALQLLEKYNTSNELLPDVVLSAMKFMNLNQALHTLHYPDRDIQLETFVTGKHPAQVRLAFEELSAHRLSLLKLRDEARKETAPELPDSNNLKSKLTGLLPFTLTSAQQHAINEIANDMAYARPMLRLLQGDVGSGKTLVAVMACLQTIENGFQAVIMAPTEILAEQHYLAISQWLEPLGLNCAYLTGKIRGKARQLALQSIENGDSKMIVGTHALFQDEVTINKLGLLVIDEQHRFGVHQRMALREKGYSNNMVPHQLIMTATPIPRTLTMSAYADLDTSVINELPPGRTPVNTVVLPDSRRQQIIDRIKAACADGRQAYWVCTLIEESEALQCQAAEATFEELGKQLSGLKVGLVHGRLKPTEKSHVMSEFKQGNLQLLVATTVIEVGVDVPNASLMIIENPERLGLAQLHQLRGRVGRGQKESHCILLYKTPLSENASKRLHIMRSTSDGFLIADEDLKIRGPGEILGTRQTGLMDLRIADLVRDSYLQGAVIKWADFIRNEHPQTVEPLIKRWLADRQRYGSV